jgi:hypothetical protein
MVPKPQRIVALLERALTAPEPMRSLATLSELRRELDALEHAYVARALQAGESFAAIAKPLGISRQAAHRRYRHLTAPPRRQTLSPEARSALLRAREEAARHGSGSIESTHLLLGIARERSLGFDLDTARSSFRPPAINAAAPSGLHPALHARLAGGAGTLQVEHLLRAALEDPDGLRLLDQLGITPEGLLTLRAS